MAVGCPTEDPVDDDDDALPDSYQEMDRMQRTTYMEETVLPRMQELFSAYDPFFPEVECETCHGADYEDPDVDYAMPNGNTELPFSGFPFSESDDPEEAAFGEFMEDDILPDIVELLDEEEFDPQTGEGFGCYGCHERPGVDPRASRRGSHHKDLKPAANAPMSRRPRVRPERWRPARWAGRFHETAPPRESRARKAPDLSLPGAMV